MSATGGTAAEAGDARQPGGDAPQGAGPTTTTGGGDSIMITVDRREYEAPKPDMTGKEIKEMAGAPPNRALILIAGDPGADPGNGGRPVPDDETVHLVRGMRFRTVNRAEFGSPRYGGRSPASRACAAAAALRAAPGARW